MFLDYFLPFYDDFLDKVPSKIRKILGLILFSIGTVLIFDIIRPESLPLGTAKRGHTDQLDDFIAWFQ